VSLLHAGPDAALPVDEAVLTALGVHRIEIPLPFVEGGGPANVLAIEDQGGDLCLFDAGVATEQGWAALSGGLADLGLSTKRLRRIVISHGHVDHYGNAQRLAEASGAQVLVHRDDLTKVLGQERWSLMLAQHRDFFLEELGVPVPVLEELIASTGSGARLALPIDRERLTILEGGERLDFARFSAEVVHCPGHTPGLICLLVAQERILFADDHVLAKVSPNPLLDFSQGAGETRFRALVSYLESARRIAALDLDVVVPGHGPSFRNHRPLLEGLFAFYERRQGILLGRLREGGPASVHALLPAIFRRIDVGRLYLMLSEVLGNLEVLQARGLVRRERGLWVSV